MEPTWENIYLVWKEAHRSLNYPLSDSRLFNYKDLQPGRHVGPNNTETFAWVRRGTPYHHYFPTRKGERYTSFALFSCADDEATAATWISAILFNAVGGSNKNLNFLWWLRSNIEGWEGLNDCIRSRNEADWHYRCTQVLPGHPLYTLEVISDVSQLPQAVIRKGLYHHTDDLLNPLPLSEFIRMCAESRVLLSHVYEVVVLREFGDQRTYRNLDAPAVPELRLVT